MSRRTEGGRLRRLAEAALAAYGIGPARLTLLSQLENAMFRVEADGGERYALRVHRATGSPFHPCRSADEVRSELVWLSALRRETELVVPEPVPTGGGSLLTVVEGEGVPEPRVCVLFRWVEGRFLDAGLNPAHLERVGGFMARLHEHALGFAPPAGFVRGRIGDVSDDVTTYVVGAVAEVRGADDAALAARVLEAVRRARRELGEAPDAFGLIHADLHQENYLFHRGRVGAIDFDDCGWGHFLHDFAVTLSEVAWKRDYDALRDGLLRGYRAVRPLPEGYDRYLPVFLALRELQLTLWFLEQRAQPGFGGWEDEVGRGLEELRKLESRLPW